MYQSPKKICKEEEEDQNDPGIIVVFSDAAQIHQVLSLPSVANVRPTLQPGPTAAQSKVNLNHWLDDLVVVNAKGDHSLVYTTGGVKEDGFYQKLGGA